MNTPELSIVVCTFNRSDLLPYSLDSLAHQTLDKSRYEVIVVDNNSTDNTRDIALVYTKKYPNFRYEQEKNQGLSHSRNKGWKSAHGTYVAYIDDDAKAVPEWAEKIVDAFANITPSPTAVGGEIHPWYESDPPEWFEDKFEIRTWGEKPHFLDAAKARTGFSGSNMTFPKKLLLGYDGFSTHLGMVGNKTRMGEETEFFNRIYPSETGLWYDPSIRIYHWVPRRNMKVSYRLKRNYKAGAASAQFSSTKVFFPELGKFILYLFQVAYFIVRTRSKKVAVRLLQVCAWKTGFLAGKIYALFR